MIAIDWSHTKELTTYDGHKVRVESRKALLKRIAESIRNIKSKTDFQAVLEQGCPLSLQYDLLKVGVAVSLIDNKATENYRQANGIDKTDEADARIIYELANNGTKLQPVTADDKMVQMADVYNQYCRFQKARVSLQNMKKAHLRHYGGGESMLATKSTVIIQPPPDDNGAGAGESNEKIQSTPYFNLVPDLTPYDIAIGTLHAREKTLLKRLETIAKGVPLFEAGGESTDPVKSIVPVHPPAIKGLGQRLWLGILVTANPTSFKCLSAYLRYCGLTSEVMATHKYNRHAKMLYHMLAEEVMKQRDPQFRPIYDKCKEDAKAKYPDYTKGHVHNAALNRTATFLAKYIYKSVRGESKRQLKSTTTVQPRTPSLED